MPVVSCASAKGDPDPVYKIRDDWEDVATTSSSPSSLARRRGKQLTKHKWEYAFDSQGRLNFGKVIHHIEKGGVKPSIRAEAWEFLLGVYSSSSTSAERNALRHSRRERYYKIKSECRKMDAAVGSGEVVTTPRVSEDGNPIHPASQQQDTTSQAGEVEVHIDNYKQNGGSTEFDAKIVQWKVVLHQIGLDVVRTDRMLQFYEDPKNLAKLWDILAVYAWIDDEVGYCQGMSDLCSPMVLLFVDEADAFWCFKCLMNRVRENFRVTNKMMGIQKQLAFLASAMQVIDPKLHQCLDALGGSTYIFAFRMLMVLFRREFSFEDTLCLWEMVWASEYHPDIHILNSEGEVADIIRVTPDYKAGGLFAKRNIKYGSPKTLYENSSFAVFFVAGILILLRRTLMKKCQGLDEVVKALNDTTGKINAHQACRKALKFHKLYLKKVKKLQ